MFLHPLSLGKEEYGIFFFLKGRDGHVVEVGLGCSYMVFWRRWLLSPGLETGPSILPESNPGRRMCDGQWPGKQTLVAGPHSQVPAFNSVHCILLRAFPENDLEFCLLKKWATTPRGLVLNTAVRRGFLGVWQRGDRRDPQPTWDLMLTQYLHAATLLSESWRSVNFWNYLLQIGSCFSI